ncbi:MAG: MFS transporter [Pseudomonadota bacterium]
MKKTGIIGAIACTTIFALTIGLTYPLLSFVLEEAGHSETAIGINGAMTPIGVLVASSFYPRVIRRFGTWQVASVCLAVSGLMVFLMGHTTSFAMFLLLRFLLGVFDVGVYIVSETWINQLADPKTRGRTIGIYATALAAGFGLGPMILSFTGVDSFLPFAIGSGLCFVAIAVVLAVRHAVPDLSDQPEGSSWSFLKLAPALLLAVAAYSFWEGSFLSLFPVFGLAFGLETGFVTMAMSVCILGNVFLQVPLGWAADKTSRRGMMVVCAMLAALGVLLLPMVVGMPWLFLPVLFVWGAVSGGLYTMAMTELGDRFSGADLVAGNAAFAIAFGVGGIVGGPMTGVAMDATGPTGFAAALCVVFVFTAAFAAWRKYVVRAAG